MDKYIGGIMSGSLYFCTYDRCIQEKNGVDHQFYFSFGDRDGGCFLF